MGLVILVNKRREKKDEENGNPIYYDVLYVINIGVEFTSR